MADRMASAGHLAGLLGPWRQARHPSPSYRALADRIRVLVLDGRLPPGTRLPSERELALALGTSRTTVTSAYGVLREISFLTSRRGAPSRTAVPPSAGARSTGVITPSAENESHLLDLGAAALTAPPGMAEAVAAASEALPAYLGGHGYTARGVPALRDLVARRHTERGLPTSPDQILVTSGALQAFALVLRTFVSPGDRVLVEHPTYPNALEAIRQTGARTVPVPLARDGWDLVMLEAAMRQSAPRLAYLIPDFHNPTGLLMDERERGRTARAVSRARTLTVVDETLLDLDLDPGLEPGGAPDGSSGALPSPLGVGTPQEAVLHIGSTSKSFWGGLGIGWLRAPLPLVARLLSVRAATDLGTSVLSQLTAAELLVKQDSILTERRTVLRSRRAALVDALRTHLPQWRFAVPRGGLSLWCELDAPVSSDLAVLAAQLGVRLASGPKFGVDGAFERYVRLPFTLPEADLRTAVTRIADAYATLTRDGPHGLSPRSSASRRIGPAADDSTPVVT
ncbi:PLP-dependent aminotransferase family protein [Actinopolymorpha pittospori]|uniref:DNA-binding transcriptional MocR family regulator n=1 Tax=Actinopolymorpha pittospori TaxID=648752 RepID=A0A927N813_9ACTN|nr:PLP-dependent aminotransferase family protein [Actinopolymorpha pittospori]MBE1611908.1 DNA-binding transcriptional MocR family regulator [Actinopolymorpha pittospori]